MFQRTVQEPTMCECFNLDVSASKEDQKIIKIQNAIKEVNKGECIIKEDLNHGHIQWKSLESTGGEDQQFLLLILDSFLNQHVLERTRGENVLDLVLSSQNELVDNVKIQCGIAASKGNQILGLIRRNITYKKRLIIPLYKAIVRPHLEYCIQA